jgi:hypothetical protein
LVAIGSSLLLTLLALVSGNEDWELVELPGGSGWYSPCRAVFCLDLWIGARGVGLAARRVPAMALLTIIALASADHRACHRSCR